MRVKTTCTLKVSSNGIISPGAIFEGTEETLPGWVLSELKLNRGTLEVLPELKKAAGRPKAVKAEKVASKPKNAPKKKEPNGKSATLREKITKKFGAGK